MEFAGFDIGHRLHYRVPKEVSRSDSRECDSAKDNERNVRWSHFKQDCAIFKVMKANEALRNWIKNMVDKNELYERAAGDVNVDEEAGAIDVEDDVIEDIVDEMDLVPVEEEMAIVPVIDTTMAEAQARAKQYIAQTSAKPQSNETEDEYAARALRTLSSREMKIDKREAKGEKTIAIPQQR